MTINRKITLDDSYRLNNGIVEVFVRTGDVRYDNRPDGGTDDRCDDCKSDAVYRSECECFNWVWQPSRYVAGVQVMLVSYQKINLHGRNGRLIYESLFDSPDGIGGNMDPNIKRYHGWRGTTNDMDCQAHGLREIIDIDADSNGRVVITIGPDLRPDAK